MGPEPAPGSRRLLDQEMRRRNLRRVAAAHQGGKTPVDLEPLAVLAQKLSEHRDVATAKVLEVETFGVEGITAVIHALSRRQQARTLQH